MKQMMTVILLFLFGITVNAQNYLHISITEIQDWQFLEYCTNDYDSIVIEKDPDCSWVLWHVNVNGQGYDYSTDEITIIPQADVSISYYVEYYDNGIINSRKFWVDFSTFQAPEPWSQDYIWKRTNDAITLRVIGGYNYQWSTGSTNSYINVIQPGTYWVRIYNDCGELYDTIQVRDNVELYRATCDLSTNLNQITWQTTPEQAEYISQVKVYRNTYQLVATAPYMDGSFTDNIGSDATQWQYHLVAVDTDGNDCPIPSYWKRTIHLDHVQGTQGEILQWTPYEEENPSKDVVIAYAIYDVVDGEPRHVIDVGNFTNVYAYNPNDFYGYGTVAAVFNNKKGLEELAFSNLTPDILSIGKVTTKNLSIYPNPSDGTFTVEGTTRLTIYNILGQIMATSYDEDGIHTFNLTPGLYFVKSDEGLVKKVIVK